MNMYQTMQIFYHSKMNCNCSVPGQRQKSIRRARAKWELCLRGECFFQRLNKLMHFFPNLHTEQAKNKKVQASCVIVSTCDMGTGIPSHIIIILACLLTNLNVHYSEQLKHTTFQRSSRLDLIHTGWMSKLHATTKTGNMQTACVHTSFGTRCGSSEKGEWPLH